MNFKLSNSQKKVLKKFNKYLIGQELSEKRAHESGRISTCSSNMSEDAIEEVRGHEMFVESNKEHKNIDINNLKDISVRKPSDLEIQGNIDIGEYLHNKLY